MRKFPPASTSPPLGSPGRVSPAESLHPAREDTSCKDSALTGKQMEISGRGSAEATQTHLKNSNNDSFQSFIYLRVKGQEFHWPAMPETGLSQPPLWCFSRTHMTILWEQLLGKRKLLYTLAMFSSACCMETTSRLKIVFLPSLGL